MQGVDEAVLKNLEACKQLSQITKTSLGPNGAWHPAETIVHAHILWHHQSIPAACTLPCPQTTRVRTYTPLAQPYMHAHPCTLTHARTRPRARTHTQPTHTHALTYTGMNKMVINHLGKLFVTNDASVIVQEMEVQHPAAKLLVMAAEAQQAEIGDGTNFVISFGGEALGLAEGLLRDGLVPSEVADGYAKAAQKVRTARFVGGGSGERTSLCSGERRANFALFLAAAGVAASVHGGEAPRTSEQG